MSTQRLHHLPIVRLDLNDQAYEAIKARLLTREFVGGQKLSLQVLADELGVSRSPVHHALTRLTSEGLVVNEPRGYVVRRLTACLMDELHEARLACELYAAEATVARVSADELATLASLCDRTICVVRDREILDAGAYLVANREFHHFQVDLAGNGTISELYRRLCVFDLQERLLREPAVRAAGDSTDEHAAIVDAYERCDLDAARQALRANVETGKLISRAAIEAAGGYV